MKISIKDTLAVAISDMHSAGTTALFPRTFWQGIHNNHTPTDFQKKLFRHFAHCAESIKAKRKGKRLVIVHNGDAIDGVHHNSLEVVTRLKTEQIEIHTMLMDFFLREVGFSKSKGDKIYYTVGTESHVNDSENIIGKDLGAEMNGDLFVFDNLHLNINGKELWFLHHGTSAGKGANEGNAHRNWLKNVFYERMRSDARIPDMIITSHTHVANYGSFVGRIKDEWHTLHGVITPSWQMKTRYAHKVSASTKNEVGLWAIQITKAGEILSPTPYLEDTTTKKAIML